MDSDNVDWHRLSTETSLERLPSRAAGLSHEESARRRRESGFNVLAEAPPRSPWMMLLTQFTDYMILVLLGAAIIAGVIGDLADTLVIVAIVVLNAAIGFISAAQGTAPGRSSRSRRRCRSKSSGSIS